MKCSRELRWRLFDKYVISVILESIVLIKFGFRVLIGKRGKIEAYSTHCS